MCILNSNEKILDSKISLQNQFRVKEYKNFRKLIYPLPEIARLYFIDRCNPKWNFTFPQNTEELIEHIQNNWSGMGIAFDKDAYWEPTNCAIHFMASSQILVGIYYTVYSIYNLQPDYHLEKFDRYLKRFSEKQLQEYDIFMSAFTKKESGEKRNPIFSCQAPIDATTFENLISQLPDKAQRFLLIKYSREIDKPKNPQDVLSSIEDSIIRLADNCINRCSQQYNYHYRRHIALSRFLVTVYYAANTVYGEQKNHSFHKLDNYLYKEINT